MPFTIDAHHHLWQLSRPFDHRWLDAPENAPIRRDVLPEALEPLLKAAGIDASIIVQTQHDLEENRWALIHADTHSFLCGVVGWVDLAPIGDARLVRGRTLQNEIISLRPATTSSATGTPLVSNPAR